MTTILDLTLFPLAGFGLKRDLHFAVDGQHTATEALRELAPGALYDQLGVPQPTVDRPIGDVVRDWLPTGWAALTFAAATDGGGSPLSSCAELMRARRRAA